MLLIPATESIDGDTRGLLVRAVSKVPRRRLLPDDERRRQFAFERSRWVTLSSAPHRVHSLHAAIKHPSVVQTFALTTIGSRGARTPGVDGVTGKVAKKRIVAFIESIEITLETGAFMPLAERKIAKPDGGVRLLNYPTLAERAGAKGIGWAVDVLFDPSFAPGVVGCRPGRGPHDALDLAMTLMPSAMWLAKIDIKDFFGSIVHDRLLARLARRIDDKKFITLIERLIQRPTTTTPGARSRGIPQGCPASPVLANLAAQPLDEWLTAMGVSFLRYVDDVLVFWTGDRAGLERFIDALTDFLQTIGLELAQKKTTIAPAEVGVPFLGHLVQLTNGVGQLHPHPDRVARFRAWMHERADALALAANQEETNAIKNQLFNRLRAFGDYYLPHRESLEIGAKAFYEAMRKYPRLGPVNPSGFIHGLRRLP